VEQVIQNVQEMMELLLLTPVEELEDPENIKQVFISETGKSMEEDIPYVVFLPITTEL